MIEFVWPWMFAALPLPLLVRLWRRHAQAEQPALTVPALDAYQFEAASVVVRRRHSGLPLALLLLSLSWIALVTAASRPQWTGEPVALPVTGRDLMLAVDISGSMGTEDMELAGRYVDRLSIVKQVINAFLELRGGDRVGLILFGTNAYLQAPLTFDLETVRTLLAEAPIGIAGGKTAVGDAIGLGVKRLRQRPDGDRVMILLTDGASNAGEVAPVKAAELAASVGVKIYTVGVGASELRVPGFFGRLGNRIVNPSADLDEEALTKVAETTGGQYFRAENPAELARIYAQIDAMEPVEQEAELFRPVQALFPWPLGCALLLLVLTMLLPVLRRGAHAG